MKPTLTCLAALLLLTRFLHAQAMGESGTQLADAAGVVGTGTNGHSAPFVNGVHSLAPILLPSEIDAKGSLSAKQTHFTALGDAKPSVASAPSVP